MRPPGLILLAAGGSSRMGQPKQLLPWKNTTLLRQACKVAQESSCFPIVVVLGCEAEACRAELTGLNVLLALNPEWQAGLGHSISTGIAALQAASQDVEGALLMLVDQPDLSSSMLGQLLAQWSPPAYPIAATFYPWGNGVPAIFHRSYFPELLNLTGDRGARHLIEREGAKVSLFNPGRDLQDLDTPEAYHART